MIEAIYLRGPSRGMDRPKAAVRVFVSTLLAIGLILVSPFVFAQSGEATAATGHPAAGQAAVPTGATLSLDQAIQIAAASSLSSKLSDLTLEVARASNSLTHALNGITITPGAGYSHSDPYEKPPQTLGSTLTSQYPVDTYTGSVNANIGSQSNPTTSLTIQGNHTVASDDNYKVSQLSAQLTQTIWNGYIGGTTWLSNSIADITLAQKLLARSSDRNTLVYHVKQAYFGMASAEDSVALNQVNLQASQKDYDRVKALHDAGQATDVELMQADVNLQSAELNESDAQDNLSSARKTLSSLIGISLDSDYQVTPPPPEQIPSGSVASLTASALSKRMDLQQLVLAEKQAGLTATLDQTQALPVVSANAGLTYNHDWNAASDKADSGTWNAGVQIHVPLSLSGAVQADVRQARLQGQSYEVQIRQLRQAIQSDVETEYQSVQSLRKHVSLAQRNLKLAETQYALVQVQEQQGTKSELDVLNDSVAVSQARTALQQAKTNLELAILKLKNTLGE